MAGMTLASIVSGNTVIPETVERFPPLPQNSWNCCKSVAMPGGRVNFWPGAGAAPFGNAGGCASQDPLHCFYRLPRSRPGYQKSAAAQAPGQIWIKRTILEMAAGCDYRGRRC